MKWLNNISMKSKMWITLSIIIVIIILFISLVSSSFFGFAGGQKNFLSVLEKTESYSLNFMEKLNRFDFELLRQLTQPRKSSYKFLESDLKNLLSEFERIYSDFKLKTSGDKNISSLLEKVKFASDNYFNNRKLFIEYLNKGKKNEAVNKLSVEDLNNLTAYIKMINKSFMGELQNIYKDNMERFESKKIEVASLFIILLVLSLLFFFIVQYTLLKPIISLGNVAKNIAEGNLDIEIKETERKDEIGQLSQRMNVMLQRLRDVSHIMEEIVDGKIDQKMEAKSEHDTFAIDVNKMIDSLNKFVSLLKKMVSSLVESATELNSSITEISASVSETSSSISETTSSAEEIKKTSDVALQMAKESVKTVEKGEQISLEVQNSFQVTQEGFDIIKTQVSILNQNIIQLAESSKTVGEIVGLVNDIADQTNILAVNASIEAARAGEQGKSFVVVAQEMKSLADQSRQATDKIRNILDETQNSVNSSVMAAEKAEKTVSEQINQANEQISVLNEIVNVMQEIKDAIKQSELTINEQNIGIGEITDAMETIKTASQQNTEATRKLSKTVSTLKSVERYFTNFIERFKI
jgi:methyl-accepting chemotaxis protein